MFKLNVNAAKIVVSNKIVVDCEYSFFFFQGWLSGACAKKKKKKEKKKSVASWEAIFTLARFTTPKKKQGSTRKLNHRAKLPDHGAFNQHTLVQHNGEQSAKHSYIENIQ